MANVLLSKEVNLIRVPARETRNASKIVFKVPTRVSPKYEKSPFYTGTKLWDRLSVDVQNANTVFEFKREVSDIYKVYEDLL